MGIHQLDPLTDSRWNDLVRGHPDATIFHTAGWLRALRDTYGFQPVVFTTSPPGADLENGLVFCGVRSWLTGRRLVSLPCSDHCDPLLAHPGELRSLLEGVERHRAAERYMYVELRPYQQQPQSGLDLCQVAEFSAHQLAIGHSAHDTFERFHADSTKRKIHRAMREGLHYDEGRGERLLKAFYHLFLVTRRRHGVPPQPFAWFRNLAEVLGDSMIVRVASYRGRPIAAIVTLHHRHTAVYKYGASDSAWHRLGGMHLLLWRTIEACCSNGQSALDLGRSDLDNAGLLRFKDRWGASRRALKYWRTAATPPERKHRRGWVARYAAAAVRRAPLAVCAVTGKLLYKHAA